MIARAKQTRRPTASVCYAKFLALLPAIHEQARFAFRTEEPERRQESDRRSRRQLLGGVCSAGRAGPARSRLPDAAWPSTPSSRSATVAASAAKLNVRDVSSEYAQQAKHFTVERLDRYDAEEGEWREILLEDRKAGPAETAAARIDIADWFASLPQKKRRIAATLATGETTKRTARKFRVSPGPHFADPARTAEGVAGLPGRAGLRLSPVSVVSPPVIRLP